MSRTLRALANISNQIYQGVDLSESTDKTAIIFSLSMEYAYEAIEALKKQLPKKPIEKHYEDDGEKAYIKICCPNGCPVQVSNFDSYCCKCGQKLDWNK